MRLSYLKIKTEITYFNYRGFKSFKDHFPEQSETLLQSLDAIYRRALQGELSLSGSSSCSSLAQKNLKPLPKLPPSSSSHSNNGKLCILTIRITD